MSGFARLVLAAAAVMLSACATAASPYAARTTPGGAGYSEARIDETHWRVEFSGDESATAGIVERDLLFRAAQLTQSSGYAWFLPSEHSADSDTEIVVEAHSTAAPDSGPTWRPQVRRRGMLGWSDWMRYGPVVHDPPPQAPARVWSYERFQARETIQMGRGEKPANAFDAAAVSALLSSSVQPQDR